MSCVGHLFIAIAEEALHTDLIVARRQVGDGLMEIKVLVIKLGHLTVGLCKQGVNFPSGRAFGEVCIGDERCQIRSVSLVGLVVKEVRNFTGNFGQRLGSSSHACGVLLKGSRERERLVGPVNDHLHSSICGGLIDSLHGRQERLHAVPRMHPC